jgi:hypothetical protein
MLNFYGYILMNTTPFLSSQHRPAQGTFEWMIQEAARQGYVYADNRFLLWVDIRVGKKVGDLFRGLIVNTRQWMIKKGVPFIKIRLDDLVNYAFMGVKRAAAGKTSDYGVGKKLGLSMRSVKDMFAFKQWFGNSKVVDGNGDPLVVYHGTSGEFSTFKTTKTGEFGPGIYLTNNPQEAREYAQTKSSYSVNVMPLYVSMQKPFTEGVDAFWSQFNENDGDEAAVLRAQKSGYDGVIVTRPFRYWDKNAKKFVDSGELSTHYIAFNPGQIKSAALNTGEYSTKSADIRHSYAAVSHKTLIGYHGTNKDFTEFSVDEQGHGALGAGFYFTPSKDEAASFGDRIIKAQLTLRNPLVLADLSETDRTEWNAMFEADPWGSREKAIEDGFDGIIDSVYTNGHIVVFEPEQILMSGGVEKSISSNFDQWFSDSKVIKPNGEPLVVYHGTNTEIDIFDITIQEELSNTSLMKWFGKSIVTNDDGSPKVVYHGTKGNFSVFRTPAWFTPDKRLADNFSESMDMNFVERTPDSKIMSVYIRLENPVITDSWAVTEPNKAMLEQYKVWEKEGHDGIIFSLDGEIEYIVFHPNQVKSVSNVGDYDLEANNIHYSLPSSPVEGIMPLTEESLKQAFKESLPSLLPCVERIFELGQSGKQGGAVIINSTHPLGIASEIAEKTGFLSSLTPLSVAGAGVVNGCYEAKSGLTFLMGNNLTPEAGVAVLMHELVHSQQNKKIDTAAFNLIANRHDEPADVRAFLDRVADRLTSVNQLSDPKEALAYIVEQAIMEYIANPVLDLDNVDEGPSHS